jgi:hypothetical protein
MRTGAPWRDLPEEFGNWNSIFRQFRRWADSGVWDVILEGLAGSGVSDAALQMIDAISGWPYGQTIIIPNPGRGSRRGLVYFVRRRTKDMSSGLRRAQVVLLQAVDPVA